MKNKYLFVCYANRNRSVVGEQVFRNLLVGRGFRVGSFLDFGEFDFYVGSAGINPEEEYRCFSKVMCEEVRTVFAADERVKMFLKRDYGFEDELKLVNLGVPDIYDIRFDKQRLQLERLMARKLIQYLP